MALQGLSYAPIVFKGPHANASGFSVPNASIRFSPFWVIPSCEKNPYLSLKVLTREGLCSNIWAINSRLRTIKTSRMRETHVLRIGMTEALTVRALQGRSPRRLVDVVRAIPKISKAYFKSPFRRALYGGIALLGGFYVAQTISLSFGALGVNDVIAAALCVLFAEYVTKFYHSRTKVTFSVALLNNFKMGFTYGLFIDAFKLAS